MYSNMLQGFITRYTLKVYYEEYNFFILLFFNPFPLCFTIFKSE